MNLVWFSYKIAFKPNMEAGWFIIPHLSYMILSNPRLGSFGFFVVILRYNNINGGQISYHSLSGRGEQICNVSKNALALSGLSYVNKHYRKPFCPLCQGVSFWYNIPIFHWGKGVTYCLLYPLSAEIRILSPGPNKTGMLINKQEGVLAMGHLSETSGL